jgi:hypothetical protein
MPDLIRSLFALALVVALAVAPGCASAPYGGFSGGDGVSTLSGDHVGHAHAGGAHGLQKTGSGEAKIAAYIFVGMLIAAVVTIDLLLLPFTTHDPFPCCRGVITICH